MRIEIEKVSNGYIISDSSNMGTYGKIGTAGKLAVREFSELIDYLMRTFKESPHGADK